MKAHIYLAMCIFSIDLYTYVYIYNVWFSNSFCLGADGIIIKMILYQEYSQITYVVQELSYRLTFF